MFCGRLRGHRSSTKQGLYSGSFNMWSRMSILNMALLSLRLTAALMPGFAQLMGPFLGVLVSSGVGPTGLADFKGDTGAFSKTRYACGVLDFPFWCRTFRSDLQCRLPCLHGGITGLGESKLFLDLMNYSFPNLPKAQPTVCNN